MDSQQFQKVREELGLTVAILTLFERYQGQADHVVSSLPHDEEFLTALFTLSIEQGHDSFADTALARILCEELQWRGVMVSVLEQILPLLNDVRARRVFNRFYHLACLSPQDIFVPIILMETYASEQGYRRGKQVASKMVVYTPVSPQSVPEDAPWYNDYQELMQVWIDHTVTNKTFFELVERSVEVYHQGHVLAGQYVFSEVFAHKMLDRVFDELETQLRHTHGPYLVSPNDLCKIQQACDRRDYRRSLSHGRTILHLIEGHKDARADDFFKCMQRAYEENNEGRYLHLRVRCAEALMRERRFDDLCAYLKWLSPQELQRTMGKLVLLHCEDVGIQAERERLTIFGWLLGSVHMIKDLRKVYNAVMAMAISDHPETIALRERMTTELIAHGDKYFSGNVYWLIEKHEMLEDETEKTKILEQIREMPLFKTQPMLVCKNAIHSLLEASYDAENGGYARVAFPRLIEALLVRTALAAARTVQEVVDVIPLITVGGGGSLEEGPHAEFSFYSFPPWFERDACARCLVLISTREDLILMRAVFNEYFPKSRKDLDHVFAEQARVHYEQYLFLCVQYAKEPAEVLGLRQRAVCHGFKDVIDASQRFVAAMAVDRVIDPPASKK